MAKKLTVAVSPQEGENQLTFSKNYRIFTVNDPLRNIISVEDITDDVDLGSGVADNLHRAFRYSYDAKNWSLWYDYTMYDEDDSPDSPGSPEESPGATPDISVVKAIGFDTSKDLYIQVKYEYNDGTSNQLTSPVIINKVNFKFNVDNLFKGLSILQPRVDCGPEQCPLVVFTREHTFQPYEVGAAVGLNVEMSFFANSIFGHDALYFKTVPKEGTADFIFKEWVLDKVVDRKCCKILVEGNEFPDNRPLFDHLGNNYETPFEVHIDKRYFESIFGNKCEPRKKDFLYFPIVNRMFEVQGAYLYRGIMMQPLYYKLTLKMYRPNVNRLLRDEDRVFLDNILLDSEELFAEERKEAVDDASMPQQYSTITEKFDETRGSLNASMSIRNINYFFNYASLIEYYYDLSTIPSDEVAVQYKVKPVLDDDMPNITFACMLNVPNANSEFNLIDGREDGSPSPIGGMDISGRYIQGTQRLSITLDLDGTLFTFNAPNVQSDRWYSVLVSISKEFGQVGFFVYSIVEDPGDPTNHDDFNLHYKMTQQLSTDTTINVDAPFKIYGGDVSLANIRIFNRHLKEEQHSFIMSQLFIADESMLYMIDNNRPRLNTPFISRNR